MDIILTHTHSDFDAIGASIAAAKLYPGAVPVLPGRLDAAVHEYVAVHKDALGFVEPRQVDFAAVRRVIVVDTADPRRIGDGEIAELLARPDVEWVVYDHHPVGPEDLPTGTGRREAMGSATTLLTAELEARGVKLRPLEATTLALGIYADTGQLSYTSTRPEDARAVAYLLAQGADLEVIGQYGQVSLKDVQQEVFAALNDVAAPRPYGGAMTLVVGIRWPSYVDGIALIAHKLIELYGLDVAVVAVEMEGKKTQLVARSRLSGVDVRALLARYGARGHTQAASAHVKDEPLEATLAHIEAALPAHMPPEPTAADLMSAPVRTVESDVSAEEALGVLARFGHNGLPVVDGSELVGIISRRDLDRAVHHGLGHAPVKGFMRRHVIVAPPEMPFSELERLMIEHDVGRLPVVRDGALLGLVTRTDMLRVLYAHREGRRAAVSRTVSELRERLRATWPVEWLALVELVGAVAGETPLYLVGGAVRDLLLGRSNLDVDLVVDGDAIALATAVGAAYPEVRVTVHRPFGTAKLAWPDGRQLDLASARTEFYERPAALPTVEFSSIKQDLARRDFSINALAVRLNQRHFGELLDFFSSRQDLEAGVLRVLHNLSFIEDPTRLLRAVRFERQLGFRLEHHSEAFARYAMATGRFDGIGGERNKVELRRILTADDPLPSAKRLSELDAWRLLDPSLRPDAETWRRFGLARRLLARLEAPAGRRWLLYLALVLAPLPGPRVAEIAARLQLNGDDQTALASAFEARATLAEIELGNLSPARLYRTLAPYGPLALALVAVLAERPGDRRAIMRFWQELKPLKLSVSGHDLRALGLPPGPRYGEILEAVLEARLNGEVSTPEAERALLMRLADAAKDEPCS